jgi:uncharacterized membrane protein
MTASPARRGYLDWLRGVAVLVMIEAHLLDSWTRFPDRQTLAYVYAVILGGFGAPLFLFLAGVAVPLSAGVKFRRAGDVKAASRAVRRRGLEVFGLAFLFRAQAWILGWSRARELLKVDILNIMGPSIAAAGWLWGAAQTWRVRLGLFSVATLAIGFLTPIIRALPIVPMLPDPVEAYIRPVAGLSNFVFFPWAGFVFAGAIAGLLIDAARVLQDERRTNIALGTAGIALACGAYGASLLPSAYSQSHFWTTSPSFFFLRTGILVAAVSVAYLWESRPGGAEKWSPLRQLGKTSLFIYWIHVEMIYGLVSADLHKALSWTQAWIAYALFSISMLLCSIGKDRIVTWWTQNPGRAEDAAITHGGAEIHT